MPDRRLVRAAGGVLWRRVDGDVRVALVHRPKYGDWSLPKGKLDPGEPAVVGGLREVQEETGFRAAAGRTLGTSRYRVLSGGREADKVVQWWAMRALDGEFVAGDEVDVLRWLPVASALGRVSAGYDCAPLRAFAEHPPETTTVLLVRHGSAGDRSAWDGPDDERPLDEVGVEQADALVDVLAAYAPSRVLSAPPVRCVRTVEPLAARLGLPVEPAPAAGEDENRDGPGALLKLVDDVASAGEGAVVVCSQGGALRPGVATLLDRPAASARKGCVWALTFAGGRLLDADYLPHPLS